MCEMPSITAYSNEPGSQQICNGNVMLLAVRMLKLQLFVLPVFNLFRDKCICQLIESNNDDGVYIHRLHTFVNLDMSLYRDYYGLWRIAKAVYKK